MRKQGKTILSVGAVFIAFCVIFLLLSRLLAPKYMTDLKEGSFISQYYREAGGHDAIFLGDCEAYNRLTIDQMRWSGSKAGIISASMTEEERFLSYVFPILRYRSGSMPQRTGFPFIISRNGRRKSGWILRRTPMTAVIT